MDRPVKRNSWIASEPNTRTFQRSGSWPSRRGRPPSAAPRARPIRMALSSDIGRIDDGIRVRPLGFDVFEHQLDKGGAHYGMPLRPESLLERIQRAPHWHGFPIRTVGAHRVKGIGHGNDGRPNGQLRATDAVWIAPAVVALVVSADQPCHLLEVGKMAEDVIADMAMLAHQLHLGVGQGARLEEDVIPN